MRKQLCEYELEVTTMTKTFSTQSCLYVVINLLLLMNISQSLSFADSPQTNKQIRKNTALKRTKVIFLSAKSKLADVEKGLELGADSYVTKPFSIKKVITDVEKMIA